MHLLVCYLNYKMHGAMIKIVSAQQIKLSNSYKDTRLKLLKTNADFYKSLSVLKCNFSEEQSMLPKDDRKIETCSNVLSVLM